MAENDATSTSAGPSGDGSSPLAASGAWAGRVDFYILDQDSAAGRLKLACKLAEKAYLAAQSVLVWHTDPDELRAFDDMLWTFNDGSFVPHEALPPDGTLSESPVQLSSGVTLSANVDIIINLAADVPPFLTRTRRVAEIIDGDEQRRRAGRARFKTYRELGVQPASHNIRGDA